MRWIWLVLLALGILIVVIISRPPAAPSCATLEIDQGDGVGTFVAFSRTPMDPEVDPEVAPARIRARSAELVTWIIRNPSDKDIYVGIHDVVEAGTTIDVKKQLFGTLDGRVLVPANCGIAALQGRLNRDLIVDPVRTDSCQVARTFFYNFYIWVPPSAVTGSKGDSIKCEWPYDPELVVEGEP